MSHCRIVRECVVVQEQNKTEQNSANSMEISRPKIPSHNEFVDPEITLQHCSCKTLHLLSFVNGVKRRPARCDFTSVAVVVSARHAHTRQTFVYTFSARLFGKHIN